MQKKYQTKQIGTVLNEFFNLDFSKKLLKLCKYSLLWTAVIPTLFYTDKIKSLNTIKTASSSSNEEYFKDLKHYICNNETNKRIDAYLKIHLNSIDGAMNLFGTNVNTTKGEIKNKINCDDSATSDEFDSYDNAAELCSTVLETESEKMDTEFTERSRTDSNNNSRDADIS